MRNLFCDFPTAKLLKELGFNSQCLKYYEEKGMMYPANCYNSEMADDDCTAPLWQQVKEWLWEKHNVCVRVGLSDEINPDHHYYFIHATNKSKTIPFYDFPNDRKSKPIYESPITTEIEGIKKAVEYLYEEHHKTKIL